MDELVERLSSGSHKVRAEYVASAMELKEAIGRGVAHIKFTDTQGGTVLSVTVDHARTKLGEANFEAGTGTMDLVGSLVLNFNEVELVAHLELGTLEGEGRLMLVGNEAAWREKRTELRDGADSLH